MGALLFSAVEKQKGTLRVTNSMGALLFSDIRVTNMKLKKNSLSITA